MTSSQTKEPPKFLGQGHVQDTDNDNVNDNDGSDNDDSNVTCEPLTIKEKDNYV